MLTLGDIKWLPSDEEDKELMYSVKGHFLIAAHILAYQFTQLGEEQVKNNFKKDTQKEFSFLKQKLEESEEKDDLLEQLREEIKSAQVEQIIEILDI